MGKAIAFLAGFAATIGQIVLMREILALFSGNEVSLGVALAAWLAWTAAGSSVAGWLARNSADVHVAAGVVECLCGISLPLTIVVLREFKATLQTVPGELFDPARMALVCIVCVSAFCVLSGSMFALAAQMVRISDAASPAVASSYAYLLETAGSALGGILASILLLQFFGCIQIGAMAGILCIWVGLSLFLRSGRSKAVTAATGVLAALCFAIVAPRIEMSTFQRLWPGFDLLAFRESIYGRLTVINSSGMRSIYDDGANLANVPDPEAAEESTHYALLEHPAPRRVLFIGGGMNGSISEALKHPTIERLDYVELDPALITMYRQLFPQEAARAFSDPRVHVHEMDGRLYLQSSKNQFDVIAVNVPDPSTAQLNRFYTTEFFQSVREHLAPGGLLALQLRSSEETISPELGAFLGCIDRTLQEVFPRVAVIPGEAVHFFASAEPAALTEDPQVLISRLKSRRLQTQYVRQGFILFRTMPDRMGQIHALLKGEGSATVNRDFHPVAYYFSAVLWTAQFGHGYARMLEASEHIHFLPVIACALAIPVGLALLLPFVPKGRMIARTSSVWCVASTGYTLMSAQLLLLLTFQAVFGYVYRELALLIGAFMAGIAVGGWLGIRLKGERQGFLMRWMAMNQFLVVISAPLLVTLAYLVARELHSRNLLAASQVIFPVMALLCGIPGGLQFPITSAIYLDAKGLGTSLTTLYALDLVGGCAGALVLAGILIPVFGFWNVAWLSSAASLPPAMLAARASFKSAGYFAVTG